jgi:hypothetical protein
MTRRLLRSALACAALALLLGACGDGPAEKAPGKAADPLETPPPGHADRWKDAPATRLRFADVSRQGGILTVNHSGRPGVKEFLFEAVGPGTAWLDYDGDGLLDLYVPDGDVLPNYDLVYQEDPATHRLRPILQAHAQRDPQYLDQLWHNNGDGTFTDVAAAAGIHESHWSFGATACDYDGDGDEDVYVSNYGPNVLWRNNGDGTFTDVAAELGVQGDRWTWSTCAAVGDVDGDGRLDFYLSAYCDPAAEVERMRVHEGLPKGTPLMKIAGRTCTWKGLPAYCGPIGLKGQFDTMLRQKADGHFEDVTRAWGLRPRIARYGFTAMIFDYDDDGLPDIYVANDSVENLMWHQERDAEGHVHFHEVSDLLGIRVGSGLAPQASMGMAVADVNQDGALDIFVTNFSHDQNNLYIAHRAAGSSAVFYKDRGLPTMGEDVFYDLSWGCGWYDFDNDGDLDLYVANGHVYKEIDLFAKTGTSYEQLNALFENMDAPHLRYREVGTKAQRRLPAGADGSRLDAGDGMAVAKCSRQAAFGDWNNDGLVDVFVENMNDAPTLLLNTSRVRPEDHWIKLGFRQPGGNREALGASYVVHRAEGPPLRGTVVRVRSFLGCDDPRQHVGLGKATTCDVTVTWPGRDRAVSEFHGLAAGHFWILDRANGKAEDVPLKRFVVRPGPGPGK